MKQTSTMSLMGKVRKATLGTGFAFLAASIGCTKTIDFVPEDYADAGGPGHWRITTRDAVMEVREFALEDDELIVHQFDDTRRPLHDVPHRIALVDVVSIQKLESSGSTLPILVITSIAIVSWLGWTLSHMWDS